MRSVARSGVRRAVPRALWLAVWLVPGCTFSLAGALAAQRPVPADTSRADTVRTDTTARRDSTHRHAAQLAPVTITAAPARRAEPSSAVTISPRVIQQTPAINTWDLMRQAAGVEVHLQGQGPGFASDASVRGFSSDHSTDLALWIDGVPINEPVNGHAEGYNDWTLIFPEAIDGIDVIKGPTSAVYGNFALAGVVNVRTLEQMQGTKAWASGGSYGHLEGTVLTGLGSGAAGSGSGVLGVRGVHEDGWRPNAGYDLGQVHLRLVRDLSASTRVDGGVELYGSRWDSPGYLSEDEFARREYDVVSNPSDGGHKYRGQERVSLRVLRGPLLWRTTAYATQGDWQLFLTIPPAGGRFEGTGSQTEEDDGRYGVGATSAATWGFARGDVTVGAEGRWDHSRYQNWFTTDRARDSAAVLVRAHQLSGALFVQSELDATDRLHLSVGARYDALGTRSSPDGEASASDAHGILTPKLGALVRLTHTLGVYGNISRGFRSTDGVISDPTLPLITEWAYEGGLKFDHGAATASVALFRADVSNEQTFNPLTSGSNNGGASRRQGVELALHTPVAKGFTLSGDWTFNDARYQHLVQQPEDDPTEVDTLSGLRVFNTARYVGSAALDYLAPSARWSIRLSGNAVGPYSPFDEPGVILPAYGLLHASGTVRVRQVELELGVRNILNKAYPELVAGHIVSPGQPRSVFGSIRYAF